MAQATLKSVYQTAKTILETSGFVFSNTPYTIDETNLPISGDGRFFSIDMQTANTDLYRDANRSGTTLQRVEHTLTVKMAFRIKPFNPLTTVETMLDAERAILDDMTLPSNYDQCRVLYQGSDRRLSRSKEFFYTDVTFTVQQSWVP
tara:strand:+ start:882 stop:1322 length:441 start_codon:yes stop_codon:yes gene_type:complete